MERFCLSSLSGKKKEIRQSVVDLPGCSLGRDVTTLSDKRSCFSGPFAVTSAARNTGKRNSVPFRPLRQPRSKCPGLLPAARRQASFSHLHPSPRQPGSYIIRLAQTADNYAARGARMDEFSVFQVDAYMSRNLFPGFPRTEENEIALTELRFFYFPAIVFQYTGRRTRQLFVIYFSVYDRYEARTVYPAPAHTAPPVRRAQPVGRFGIEVAIIGCGDAHAQPFRQCLRRRCTGHITGMRSA